MFMLNKCLIVSVEQGPERILSCAMHVIRVGELGPVQLAWALHALMLSRNRFVDTMAVDSVLSVVFMSTPSGLSADLITRLLKRSMSSVVHCRVQRLLTARAYSGSPFMRSCSVSDTTAFKDFQASLPRRRGTSFFR